jgi:ATP dependent DNA ligase domain
LKAAPIGLQYSDHIVGQGGEFFRHACQVKAEGVVSKRVDAPYGPGDRSGSWLKIKCLNREEFIVVGWTDPEGTRPHLGRCCSPITRLTALSCTRGAQALAFPYASWRGFRRA